MERPASALWSPPLDTGCTEHGRCNWVEGHVDQDGQPIGRDLTWVRESAEAMGLVLETADAPVGS